MARYSKSAMKLEMLASTLRKAEGPLTLADVRALMKCGTEQEIMSKMQVFNHLQNLTQDNPEFQRVDLEGRPHYVWVTSEAAYNTVQDVTAKMAAEQVRHAEAMTELLVELQALGVSA